jgi:hypothetical protein
VCVNVLTCLPSRICLHGLPTTFFSVLGESVHVLTYQLSQFTDKSRCNQWYPVLRIMDFLSFSDISFLPNSSIGEMCEDLNTIIGQGIWYDTFQIRNTKWLWLVNNLVTTLNSDNTGCATFGLYPSYVAGILNSVNENRYYVMCNEHKLC